MGDYYHSGCCICCLSKNKRNAIAKNKEIDLDFIEQRKRERREIKLLVLGSAESGKSTLLKQIKMSHGNGYSEDERRGFSKLVHQNIFLSMKTMTDAMSELRIPYTNPQNQIYAQWFQNQDSHQITKLLSFVEPIRHLWADEGFKNCFKLCKKNHRHLTSLEYFVDRLDQITANNYIPTIQDILRVQSSTNAIAELSIPMQIFTFRFINVGGQRGQRRKWIHHFENVTTVIFVASLSEYDEFLEENNKNRMEESLSLFNSVTSSPWLAQSSILLLLNKKDFLAKKIQFSHLKTFFPEFTGKIQDADDAMKFILKSYERNVTPDQLIYSQFICATDFIDTKIFFDAVKDTILRQTMANYEVI
ncbi:guanine nucleotide binding protein (G protein), alpha 15 (Gq class), tandem duplicate 4 isoform X1 [Danio rerio]|uniref:Guanine nucleotide binding protein (G protein), alpha 15 (Gq class), tandem duplicate 4 isoform X1 n=2 Tax=Danio rerio TaxID=7955 RepID=A0AC58IEP3_DANRE